MPNCIQLTINLQCTGQTSQMWHSIVQHHWQSGSSAVSQTAQTNARRRPHLTADGLQTSVKEQNAHTVRLIAALCCLLLTRHTS
jgi:hypothetical protein